MSPIPLLWPLPPISNNEIIPGLIEALETQLFREEPADPFVPRTTHLYESLPAFFSFKKLFLSYVYV